MGIQGIRDPWVDGDRVLEKGRRDKAPGGRAEHQCQGERDTGTRDSETGNRVLAF